MAAGVEIGNATVLAVLGEGRRTATELQEAFGVKASTPEAQRLSVCLAHLKKSGRVVHPARGAPWALAGPKQENKSQASRFRDFVEDLYDWLSRSPVARTNTELAKEFGCNKNKVLRAMRSLGKRVRVVGGGNKRKWEAVRKRDDKPIVIRVGKPGGGPVRITERTVPERRRFGVDLDDQLRAERVCLLRQIEAIDVLLEGR